MIDWLKRFKGMKWSPREDTPDSHLVKAGVPSMGGIGIIGVALLVFVGFLAFTLVVIAQQSRGFDFLEVVGIVFFALIVGLHALLGFSDDWSKATGRGGLRARDKLGGQIVLACIFVFGSLWLRKLYVTPFSDFAQLFDKFDAPIITFLGCLFLALIVIAASNAVNLTDGIDGLAAGLSLQCALVFGFICGKDWLQPELHFEVGWTWLALGGACLGFLAFNKHPAKVFMGDTGSLALGAALGAGAILTRSVFLLPFIGLIFWVEMFSVIAQVLYFKWTKRKTGEGQRIFRRAPLHHHFELGGWSEWRVVGTFWIVNLVASIIGLVLWQAGVLPRFP